MRPLVPTLVAVLAISASPADAAGSVLEVPPARVGDAWAVLAVQGAYRFDLRIEERTSALDRWGVERDAFPVSVDGFHPLQWLSMTVTGHHLYIDAASGTQIADVGVGFLDFGPPSISQPGAYSAFNPNDLDAWPGWALAGGLLAGRELAVGETVEVPVVQTRSHGNDRLTLTIEEAPDQGSVPCVRAVGTAIFPRYFAYQDGVGYDRGELRAALDILQCEDSPYAARTDVTYSGALTHSVDVIRDGFTPGAGEVLGVGPFQEPDRHVQAAPVPFDGALRDGGPLQIWSLEEAQEAAGEAPGLIAWRVLHPDGYLVEAAYIPAAQDEQALNALGLAGERWSLTFAEPSGDQHRVETSTRGGVVTAVDMPQAEGYPNPVPPLSAWPAQVASPSGVIASWRSLAGPGARLSGLRWEPLLDRRWHVVSELDFDCQQEPCGTAVSGLDMTFDHETGAAAEGLHPVPG
jgi:hypothetical protein